MKNIPHLAGVVAVLAILAAPVWGQAPDGTRPVSSSPRLSGPTFEGQAFDLAGLRGKVVLVVFWSTGCAVCRDKMGELRANYEGWRGQPFELVLVSKDRRFQDVQAYEQILAQTVPRVQRFPQLWGGHST